MQKKLYVKSLAVGLGLVGTLSVSTSSLALDLPQCASGEYLWLVTAGNPVGTLIPKADMRLSTVTFQDWTDGKKTLRTAAFTNVPKGRLGEAKTFERYTGGGNLGWFSKSWPSAVEGYEVENFKPLPPRNPAPSAAGREYPTDFASSNLTDGLPGETLAQVLSSPRFDGRLTYIAPAEARIDFVTIALCTSALPTTPPPPKPIQAGTDSNSDKGAAQRLAAAETAVKSAAEAAKQARSSADIAVATKSAAAEDFRRAAQTAANLAEAALDRASKAQVYLKANPTNQSAASALQAGQKAAQDAEAQKLIAFDASKAAVLAEEEAIKATTMAPVIVEPPVVIEPKSKEPIVVEEEEPVVVEEDEPAAGEDNGGITEIEDEEEPALLDPPKLRGEMVAKQTKLDMKTSGGMAAVAVVNSLANVIGNMLSASRTAAPVPAPAPSPAPQPTPSLASGGGTGRKKENAEKKDMPRPEPTVLPPQPSPAPSSPQDTSASNFDSKKADLKSADAAVIIDGSKSYTGEIPDASAEISRAYAAVGRVGYPHAPRAARDAMDLGFGSAVLIQPNKVLTNQHVWNIIKDMRGVGIEFDAREGNEISEFITLENTAPKILEGLDAVVLTLSRRVARPPIWPKAINYADPEITERIIYAIGHPIKPKDASSTVKLKIIDEFGSSHPLWNVKRFSAGPIARHKEDIDGDVLLDVPVADYINDKALSPALCHLASTIGGNSGGAVICAASGDFLGLHFGGQRLEGENINYAVPGRLLLKGLKDLGLTPEGIDKAEVTRKSAEAKPKTAAVNLTPAAAIIPAIGAGVTGDLFEDTSQAEAPDVSPIIETENKVEQSLTEYITSRSNEGSAPAENTPDDLTRIEGIGPQTATALKEAGVSSFKALAQGSPYDLLPLLEAAGLPRRDPTTWPAQAALAANGDWDRLKAWQDQLHGGRETS